MPTEQSQLEYYHYYRASQKRVQQWVQKTSQELQVGRIVAGRSSDLRPNRDGDNNNEKEKDAGSNGGSRRRASRRRSPSPSSKRQIHHDQTNTTSRSRGPSSRSRSTRKKAKTDDVRVHTTSTRSRKPLNSSDGMAISSLLPFGLLPLIFALTPPSVATIFSAMILLAGYFCVDYGKRESISEKL